MNQTFTGIDEMKMKITLGEMRILRVKPGSDEWLAARRVHKCASDASVMMGESQYMSRSDLVRITATGAEKEFSEWVQKNLLEKGHGIEARERPFAAEFIRANNLDPQGVCDGALFPVVLARTVNGEPYLASTDGRTISGRVIWECKSWNEAKAVQLEKNKLPSEDLYQCTQQMLTGGAEYLLYTLVSEDQSKRSNLVVHRDQFKEYFKYLVAGWLQFDRDVLEEQRNPRHIPEKVTAEPVASLPIVRYSLDGLSIRSNIDVLRQQVQIAVAETKKDLKNDQDFANLEAMCKKFGEAEKNIATVIEQVLGDFGDIDAFRRGLSEIQEIIRSGRLAGEKKVKHRKEEIKKELRDQAREEWDKFVEGLNGSLNGKLKMPSFGLGPDIDLAMRNKKSIKSMIDAIEAEIASAKIVAEEVFHRVEAAGAIFNELASNHGFLFRDAQELVNSKDNETIRLIIKTRIDDYEEEQRKKREEEEAAEAARVAAANQKVSSAQEENEPDEPDLGQPCYQSSGLGQRPSGEAVKANQSTAALQFQVVDIKAVLQEIIDGNLPFEAVNLNSQVIADYLQATGAAINGIKY